MTTADPAIIARVIVGLLQRNAESVAVQRRGTFEIRDLDDDGDEAVLGHSAYTVRSSSVGSVPSNQSVVSTRLAIFQPSAVRTSSSS